MLWGVAFVRILLRLKYCVSQYLNVMVARNTYFVEKSFRYYLTIWLQSSLLHFIYGLNIIFKFRNLRCQTNCWWQLSGKVKTEYYKSVKTRRTKKPKKILCWKWTKRWRQKNRQLSCTRHGKTPHWNNMKESILRRCRPGPGCSKDG